uniref:Ig-like domain-containing protein n=1 Tax=Sciurus vulgaris TaxID=55149 RepID=A0A8D2ASL7_SCIVU
MDSLAIYPSLLPEGLISLVPDPKPNEALFSHFWFSLYLIPGVLCQVELQESKPGLVKPSETLSLTCDVSGLSIMTSGYGRSWISQFTGKGLEWIGEIWSDGSTNYSPSLKSQVDTSKNQFSLQLSSLTTQDMATCYCARDTLRGPQCEPRHKPPHRVPRASRVSSAHRELRGSPAAAAKGGENFFLSPELSHQAAPTMCFGHGGSTEGSSPWTSLSCPCPGRGFRNLPSAQAA